MLLKFNLHPAALGPDGLPIIEEYQVELLQEAQGELAQKAVLMTVPRDEFYNACWHYKGQSAVDTMLGLEVSALGKANKLRLRIKDTTLGDYIEAMFKGGRWREGKDETNPYRSITTEDR